MKIRQIYYKLFCEIREFYLRLGIKSIRYALETLSFIELINLVCIWSLVAIVFPFLLKPVIAVLLIVFGALVFHMNNFIFIKLGKYKETVKKLEDKNEKIKIGIISVSYLILSVLLMLFMIIFQLFPRFYP